METPAIYQDMTAFENLRMQYQLLGLPSFEGIPEFLELVGLEKVRKKKAKDFLLCMRQRLGIVEKFFIFLKWHLADFLPDG